MVCGSGMWLAERNGSPEETHRGILLGNDGVFGVSASGLSGSDGGEWQAVNIAEFSEMNSLRRLP
jgi:hypothetical protein